MLTDIFSNRPLVTALAAMLTAQVLKVGLILVLGRRWEPARFLETGGMPSSHTASVFALATSCGISEGWKSPIFAVAAMFGLIVTYDATGVRREAGFHAELLNDLVVELRNVVREGFKPEPLEELLGHTYLEVFFGAMLGIAIALVSYFLLRQAV